MGTQEEVTKAEWRATDRRRAVVIYVIAAIVAAALTAVLYFL